MIDEHKIEEVAREAVRIIFTETETTAEALFVVALVNQATSSAIAGKDIKRELFNEVFKK